MKILLLFFVLVSVISPVCMAFDYTTNSNPDGRIGSFIWTIGGNVGSGSLREKIQGYHPEKYGANSYAFLCRLDCPTSKKTTVILQFDYSHDKIGSSGTYFEDVTTGFKVGMYFKFFSK